MKAFIIREGIDQTFEFFSELSPMASTFSDKKLHKIGRIDQCIRDFFEKNKSVQEFPAKDLMPLFVQKGLFLKDHRKGLPIRNLLRELDAVNQLHLLKLAKSFAKW